MPEITILIGGRSFEVVCKDGEEPFLQSAAALLDVEAQTLTGSMGRIPESRMLLMAGLMLADKTASLEDQLAAAGRANEGGPLAHEITAEIAQLKGDLKATQTNLKTVKDALISNEKEATVTLEAKDKELADMLEVKEKELADTQVSLTDALEAMKRMVVALEEKGA
ncbi:MAG: cell division protein ZapA [Proteobacteria bacterium]|nr:cell division protein ZapA [Pseudomonadota bacterium]